MRGAGQGRHFPVREMRGEDERGLAVVAQADEAVERRLREFDMAGAVIVRIVIPDAVEMGEFDADAAEIVPDAAENGLDLCVGFFRKGHAQIFLPDPVLAQFRPDLAHQVAGEIRHAVRIGPADRLQQADRERAKHRVAQAVRNPDAHQNVTMTFPNT